MPARADLTCFHLIYSNIRFSLYDLPKLVRRHAWNLHTHWPYYQNTGYKSRLWKKPFIYLRRIADISCTISRSALANIHTLLEPKGNIGVNQPHMSLKKYREVNVNRNSIWIVILLTGNIQQNSFCLAFVYVFRPVILQRKNEKSSKYMKTAPAVDGNPKRRSDATPFGVMLTLTV